MKKTLLVIASLIGMSTLFVACGDKGNSSSPSPNQQVTTAQMCSTPGYVQTTYGCVPQCPGNPNMGMYNNTCIPVSMNTNSCPAGQINVAYPVNGCVPQCPSNPTMGYVNGQCVAAAANNFYNSMYGNQAMYSNNTMMYYPMYYQQYQQPIMYPSWYLPTPSFSFRFGW